MSFFADAAPVNGYTGFFPGKSEVLPKGQTLPGWSEGERTYPLECDILFERDIEIKVRDGARLYTDIYRPANCDEKIPVLVMWSPYGQVHPLQLYRRLLTACIRQGVLFTGHAACLHCKFL